MRQLLKENVQLLLRIIFTSETIVVKQLKVKMFMYFWLNYCHENHVERIPIAVNNINHVFDLATGRVESDTLHLFQGRI